MAVINKPTLDQVTADGTTSGVTKPSQGTVSAAGVPTYKLTPTITLYDSDSGRLCAYWTPIEKYKSATEKYEYKWQETTGAKYANGGYMWEGDSSTTTDSTCFFTPSASAIKVRFIVRPIQKEGYKKFSGQWSTEIIYTIPVENSPVETPPAPNVSLDGLQLNVELNIDYDATLAHFIISRDNSDEPWYYDSDINYSHVDIRTGNASLKVPAKAGSEYKAKCRVYYQGAWSEWSNWSQNVRAAPGTPSGITKCEATSSTSIYVEWASVNLAESYTLEWAEKKSYFDGSNNVSSKSGITVTHFELTGLESGKEYFFRVKAVGDSGESGWSEIKSVVIGKGPVAPTTWSSTTTAMLGESVTLYWVHNAEDGSAQTYANLELDINGVVTTEKITGETNKLVLNTGGYAEGAKVKWRVQTAGITKIEGDWSIQRTVEIYSTPVLEMNVTDSSGSNLTSLKSLPINISANASPSSQTPISYRVSVVANDSYETEDDMGIPTTVNSGQSIYSKYIDPSVNDPYQLELTLSAADLTLENGIRYSIICSVTMDSGLTAEAQHIFTVYWDSLGYYPNARINIDTTEFTAMIQPFCEKYVATYYQVTRSGSTYSKTSTVLSEMEGSAILNSITTTGEQVYQATVNGSIIYYCIILDSENIDDVLLSVYRRDSDGSFVEIASDLDGAKNISVTDPHPALDYARYRIVAKTKSTSEVTYTDIPAIYIGGNTIIIQWDEEFSSVELSDSEHLGVGPLWNGLALLLPYNIDISDKYDPDVELAKYIGRKNPVSYYGTQIGHTSTWNTEIPKNDAATIYGLRKLSNWMGDVYVREPSGSGYWANVKVTFGKKHKEVTIPVAIEVTRVEGGA